MSETQQRYSQIEEEALAITWACERFNHFLLGSTFTIQTYHKPLVPLLSTKNLDELPPRVLRFRLRLMRFTFDICHVPGKNLTSSDALSRAPVSSSTPEDTALQSEVTAFIAAVKNSLPATDQRLSLIQSHQAGDEVCSQLLTFCSGSWPDKHQLPGSLRSYWAGKGAFDVNQNGLLLYGQRIVILAALRM